MSIEEMTIDETIDGLCDQMGFGDPVLINAILHLRAYKENNPLTWEDLKSMEGKPVFVEERYRNGDLKSAGWWLIDYWYDDQICLRDQGGNPWNAHRTSLGRDWQVYRKERDVHNR